jgi:SET domain-containing protein
VRVAPAEGKGRGVFAQRNFAVGEIIEAAPVLFVPAEQWPHLERTVLDNYCFAWGEALEHAALGLGCSSFYNHADDPSAHTERDFAGRVIRFVARRPIELGDEVTFDYRSAYDEWFPMWFDVC